MVSAIVIALGVVLALGFLLAPLVRSEADLKPLQRPYHATVRGRGLSNMDVELLSPDTRRCPHCGAAVDAAFDFCGECASPLP